MKAHLLKYACAVGTKIAKEYINNRGYFPKEPWGCEGQIYPSMTGIALLELYKATKNNFFLTGAKAIVDSNIEKQKSSGGWPLYLAANANGVRFHVSDDIIKMTSELEDLPSTTTALRLISEYQQITDDKSYSKFLNKGFNFIKEFWNTKSGVFDEMLSGEALKLRANPRDYHIYAFQCVQSLQKIYPSAREYVSPLYLAIKSNFEEMTVDTYPLLYGMHAGIIAKTEGPSDYVTTVVKEKILKEISINSKFLIPDLPGAMGHRDGLRGICLDEGHLRNSIGAVLAVDLYESVTGSNLFSSTKQYAQIESWVQSMYDDGIYFEYMDLDTGLKHGDGSAGIFLPIFWILKST